jgi:flagellar hook-associated protein 1 FlgK
MNIGASALLTQQRAINVAGNNIANVNTPGYSRQTLRLETRTPIASPEGPVGFGVRSAGIERAYDRYLGVQLIGEMSNFGRWEARQGMLERVEVVLDESDGYGLTQALSEFWNAWQNLALNPSGQIEREVTAAAGQSLADTLRRKYTDLEQVQEDIDVAVEGAVEDINRLAAEISELNRKIAQTEVGGIAANDYRDSRDRVLKDLGELIEIHAYEDAQGGIVVSVGSGRALVESGNTYELSTRSVDGHTNILWPDSRSGWADITREISAGRIGGWLQVRDEDLAGYQQRLEDLADGLRTEVNALHEGGRDLNGDPGLEFFEGTGAQDFFVNGLITADVNLVAAASGTGAFAPGDSTNALAVAGLRTGLTMSGGSATFDDAVNSLISLSGYDSREAKAQTRHQEDMLTYLENYRESVSGVSLDEEMVSLVKFQAAYDAAAKVISMADEMLNNLMNMIR